jgi:hypothetical protein
LYNLFRVFSYNWKLFVNRLGAEMEFGGLSEQEVKKITEILENENIKFQVSVDGQMISSNKQSLDDNLRHYRGASLSTHILTIIIKDESFAKLSEPAKMQLLNFGITDIIPNFEETTEEIVEMLQNKESAPLFFVIWGNRFIIFIMVFFGSFMVYYGVKLIMSNYSN